MLIIFSITTRCYNIILYSVRMVCSRYGSHRRRRRYLRRKICYRSMHHHAYYIIIIFIVILRAFYLSRCCYNNDIRSFLIRRTVFLCGVQVCIILCKACLLFFEPPIDQCLGSCAVWLINPRLGRSFIFFLTEQSVRSVDGRRPTSTFKVYGLRFFLLTRSCEEISTINSTPQPPPPPVKSIIY